MDTVRTCVVKVQMEWDRPGQTCASMLNCGANLWLHAAPTPQLTSIDLRGRAVRGSSRMTTGCAPASSTEPQL